MRPGSYLKLVALVVVHVENSEEFHVPDDQEVFALVHAVADGLPGKLLHLDIVELTEVAEPLLAPQNGWNQTRRSHKHFYQINVSKQFKTQF